MSCYVGEKYGNWCQGEHLLHDEDKKSYCIFHAPLHLKPSAQIFNQAVMDYVESISEDSFCDLRGTIFPYDISFDGRGLPSMSLTGAVFYGKADFSNVFFAGRVRFRGTMFNDAVSFRYTAFDKEVLFKNAQFLNTAEFKKSAFLSGADFWNSKFASDVDFSRSQFNEDAGFNGCVFEKGVLFTKTQFQRVRFEKTCFEGHIHFMGTSSTMRSSFSKCIFKKSAHFIETNFVDADFSNLCAEQTVFFKETDLRRSFFKNSPVESLRFSACKWPLYKGRRCISDARRIDGKGYFELEEQGVASANLTEKKIKARPSPSAYSLEDLFRRLKKNARDESNEVLSSDMHFFEKEMQRIRLKEDSGNLTHRFYLAGYKFLSEYGESPRRAMWILLFLVFLPFFTLWLAKLYQLQHVPDWELTISLLVESVGYLPFAKHVDVSEYNSFSQLCLYIWPISVGLQAALFSLAVRNKLRR